MRSSARTLVLGWGNPGRGDDGLGQALTDVLDAGPSASGAALTIDSDYQLQIEHAAEIARHDRVVFVDANRSGPEPFSCSRIFPAETGLSFTSHSVTPGALLALARELFGSTPEAWLVGIRGYQFDVFQQDLSSAARANLDAAAAFLRCALQDGRFEEAPPVHRQIADQAAGRPDGRI